MTTFEDLFNTHAVASFDKQLVLSNLIGDADWQVDLESGIISFGASYTFPIQILGTESELSDTWLWAWANNQSDIPENSLRAANDLRRLGLQNNIDEFTNRQIDLTYIQGHQLSLVASGVCNSDCYYRGPYEGGALFMLIDAPILRQRVDISTMHLINVFVQFISTFDINHHRALNVYLQHKGYTTIVKKMEIEGIAPNGAVIHAKFDATARMIDISSSAK